MTNMKNDKQSSKKHYTENWRASNLILRVKGHLNDLLIDDYNFKRVTLRWLLPTERDIEITNTYRGWHWDDYWGILGVYSEKKPLRY
jgi:hypothetical protein